MESFEKRSGAWRAVIRKKGFPTQTATFDAKSEAQAWAADTEAAMAGGRFRPSTRPSTPPSARPWTASSVRCSAA